MTAVEERRVRVSKSTEAKKKSQLGQFLTPAPIAAFMAGLFADKGGACRLLDAGAGIGSLSAAFLDRVRSGGLRFDRVLVEAFELDPALHHDLEHTLAEYASDRCVARVIAEDFIQLSADSLGGDLFRPRRALYTHCILNPPYKKLHSQSPHRLALRRAGIETVNLYSAFVALALAQMAPGGQLVAIVPRSFCNGPYYRPFRNFLLTHAAIHRIHLFESRAVAFKDDDVLQENVIVVLERDGTQGPVTVSSSTDAEFTDLAVHAHPFERIVSSRDEQRFIHIPASSAPNAVDMMPDVRHSLAELGIGVSTGPVVDFRVKAHLRGIPEPGAAPLLYANHFAGGELVWPVLEAKKPNAIALHPDTKRWLYPRGFYCVVRRFSSKEERRRIVASVVTPAALGDAPLVGFENHLNVFHENRGGLPELLARGLAVFLNSSAVDECFRSFNGHTQVNATDVKLMKFPSRAVLNSLGEWAVAYGDVTQDAIDARVGTLIG